MFHNARQVLDLCRRALRPGRNYRGKTSHPTGGAKEQRMSEQTDVVDSPADWVNKHIRSYVATDGVHGHEFRVGSPVLLLTVVGRKSGLLRRTALIYGRDGADYVVVASAGGTHSHPAWYLNLAENPDVQVQVMADKFAARARTAVGEERERLWQKMAAIWPDDEVYQKKTDRTLPVVVLEPVG
jgi:deazaflavin-dependent oxidoreductase (nitroreductase family)